MLTKIPESKNFLVAEIALMISLVTTTVITFLHVFDFKLSDVQSHVATVIVVTVSVAVIAWALLGRIERLNEELKLLAHTLDKDKIDKAVEMERVKAEKNLEIERIIAEKQLEVAKVEAEKQLEVARIEAEKRLEVARIEAEKKLEVERGKTHQATLVASYHYLNNALNEFQMVLLQLETTGTVNKTLVEQIKASIHKTASEMREFGQLKSPTHEDVHKFIQDRL